MPGAPMEEDLEQDGRPTAQTAPRCTAICKVTVC